MLLALGGLYVFSGHIQHGPEDWDADVPVACPAVIYRCCGIRAGGGPPARPAASSARPVNEKWNARVVGGWRFTSSYSSKILLNTWSWKERRWSPGLGTNMPICTSAVYSRPVFFTIKLILKKSDVACVVAEICYICRRDICRTSCSSATLPHMVVFCVQCYALLFVFVKKFIWHVCVRTIKTHDWSACFRRVWTRKGDLERWEYKMLVKG